MPVRALIIAIERYPQLAGGAARDLPGTLTAGLEFKRWLTRKWADEQHTAADTEIVFCSEPVQPGGRPATLIDLKAALLALKASGQGATDELFVFFSGHGFTFSEPANGRTDYLLASDFVSAELTADRCLNLDGLVNWLRDHLGPGRHYYFIDACRNRLTAGQIVPGPLGLPIDSEIRDEASSFVLQSTVDGDTAAVGAAFPSALMSGLGGKGTSKTYDPNLPDAMVVRYGTLRTFIQDSLRQQTISHSIAGRVGEEVVLATLKPIPLVKCTVRVEGTAAGATAELLLRRGRDAAQAHPLTLPESTLTLEPDHYDVSLRLMPAAPASAPGASAARPASPVRLPLFDDTRLVFRGGTLVEPLAPALLRGGLESAMGIGAPTWAASEPHRSILARLPNTGRAIDFSESLGLIDDDDLDVWLAILGAGRVLAGHRGHDYSKIGPLPLHDFSNEQPGASPVYVLAGLSPGTALDVGLSTAADVVWRAAQPVTDMPGMSEWFEPGPPGPRFLSFRLPGTAAYTVASLTTANRATLVTVTRDDGGALRVSQYLLPIGRLIPALPPEMRAYVEGQTNHLADVRALAVASRVFRRRGNLDQALPAHKLDELLYAKWVDPIGSSLAAYQLVRRGAKDRLGIVVENMLRFFPDLPDGAALARLSGRAANRPPGVPLILDGLRAFPDYADWLPLPAGQLDFTGPWTAWRGAVR